jgi:hypothetical protein
MPTRCVSEVVPSERFVEPEELCTVCGGPCVAMWKELPDEPDCEQDGCRA